VVNNQPRHLDLTFGSLAHPIRRGILLRLASGEASVAELARPFKVSAPAITKHLRVLERARLLSRKKDGRVHRCRLESRRMDEAAVWLEEHRKLWNARLDRLERFLKENP
jgi:DNA-binding transcriptional ArsR family regulator